MYHGEIMKLLLGVLILLVPYIYAEPMREYIEGYQESDKYVYYTIYREHRCLRCHAISIIPDDYDLEFFLCSRCLSEYEEQYALFLENFLERASIPPSIGQV